MFMFGNQNDYVVYWNVEPFMWDGNLCMVVCGIEET